MQKVEPPDIQTDALARELNDELVRRYGLLMSSSALAKELGYPSANAYCQAVVRGTLPVPLFQIPNRRGRFALARDVAIWLSQQRQLAATSTESAEGMEPISR